jgi:hypothetical protein
MSPLTRSPHHHLQKRGSRQYFRMSERMCASCAAGASGVAKRDYLIAVARHSSACSPEPVEFGGRHVEGLCEYVIEAEEIARVALPRDLCSAPKRFREG